MVEFEDLMMPDSVTPLFDTIGADEPEVLDLSTSQRSVTQQSSDLDATIEEFDRLWSQGSEHWPNNVIEQNSLEPSSPHIIELDNGTGRDTGLFKIFNEGTIQSQELSDFTTGRDWMPQKLGEIRKQIGYTGTVLEMFKSFWLPVSIWY